MKDEDITRQEAIKKMGKYATFVALGTMIMLVIQKLLERIESGDQRAIELFLKYRAGLPKQEIDLNTTATVDHNIRLRGLIGFDDE